MQNVTDTKRDTEIRREGYSETLKGILRCTEAERHTETHRDTQSHKVNTRNKKIQIWFDNLIFQQSNIWQQWWMLLKITEKNYSTPFKGYFRKTHIHLHHLDMSLSIRIQDSFKKVGFKQIN